MTNFLGVERLHYGPWQAFERAIQRFMLHKGFEGCQLVGRTGDKGGDVVGSKRGKLWVVQAKFRRDGCAIGEDAVLEVVQALNAYSASVAAVATNQHFARGAYEAARNLSKDIGAPIYLWAGEHLLKWSETMSDLPQCWKELRQYQIDAIEEVESRRAQGAKTALVVMATGLGKTRVAAELVLRETEFRSDKEVLVLAHTVPLVHQLERALWDTLPRSVPTHIWAGGERPAFAGGVVFATMQTALQTDSREELAGRFGLIVVDEAHHAPADGYSRLLRSLSPDFMLGMTATPWRTDDRTLSEIFGQPAFTLGIVEGMQKGHLADVDYRMLVDNIDWDAVTSLSSQGLTVSELNRRLFLPDRDEAVVSKIVHHLDSLEHPRCLIFCRSRTHADAIHSLLRACGRPCAIMHSGVTTIERARALSEFRRGDVGILVSVDMLNEGIDVPEVNVVVFLRVTHSRRIFVQQLGRGLRLQADKSKVTVLDFVADIRRIAAGMSMNQEARNRGASAPSSESIRFTDGNIVTFSNDQALSLFTEYLADVAAIEDLHDGSLLHFPPTAGFTD